MFLLLSGSLSRAGDAPFQFLGSQSCASAMCHGGADDKHNEFFIWTKKDFHTRAPATLTMARSARIAETLKIKDPTADARCTVCHNPFQAIPVERKGPLIGKLEGVSCESCHNAAEPWLLTHTRTDLTYEQKVAVGLRDLKNLYVRANTCVACHQNLEPDVRAAGHPELIFELDGQCAAMPRHWTETNRWRGAQAWLVGQAVAMREGLAQGEANKGADDIAQRASAIAAALGLEATASAADKHARSLAERAWSEAEIRAQLRNLASSGGPVSRGATNEMALRAERIVLGLERLLIALDLHKSPGVSAKLDRLFKEVQSRQDFAPQKFTAALKEFEAELDKVEAR